jgi:peptide/nickel transport system permease protein
MSSTDTVDDVPLRQRIRENPRPALVWGSVMGVLVLVQLGSLLTTLLELVKFLGIAGTGLLDVLVGFVNGPTGGILNPVEGAVLSVQSAIVGVIAAAQDVTSSIPTLLTRELIPNQGFRSAPGVWEGTFLGLEPKWAWLIRVALIYAYAFVVIYWAVKGYFVYRDNYREADWTPRDNVIKRMRSHRWGQFGFVIVALFLTMAIFAPALGPTTVEKNIQSPYKYDTQYYHEEAGEVREVYVGLANLNSGSSGAGSNNIGPGEYDQYDRYHPFGTLPTGKDMFTFMAAGARISLFIGLLAIGLGGLIAATMALVSAYYKGIADLATVLVSDSIMSVPGLLLLIMVSVAFRGHWLNNVFDGGLLIGLTLAFINWPILWRSLRGPAFQVSEQEWVDAARSYGQQARVTMQKHMLPYIAGYLLIYGSMTLGGVIITTSALSFLGNGLGIQPPTPEWGQAIAAGQGYVATQSWHISMIPGVLIVLVVTAFNALGDGIRDAIDPQSDTGEGGEAAAAGGGA